MTASAAVAAARQQRAALPVQAELFDEADEGGSEAGSELGSEDVLGSEADDDGDGSDLEANEVRFCFGQSDDHKHLTVVKGGASTGVQEVLTWSTATGRVFAQHIPCCAASVILVIKSASANHIDRQDVLVVSTAYAGIVCVHVLASS